MPFKLVILWTDAIFFSVLFCLILLVLFRTRGHYQSPWRYVWRDKVGMCSAVVLFFYLVIAFLDSLHFTTYQSGQIKSLLDLTLSPLDSQMETTYSAPFSINYGTQTSVFTIILSSIPFFLLSFSMLMGIVLLLVKRRKARIQQFLNPQKNKICVREFVFTFAVMLFICIVFYHLSRHYHIMGTDKIGQDVFYQAVKSIRTGVLIGTLTTIVMLPFALFMGTVAGYFRGIVDDIIQYIYTTLSSIPSVLLIAASVLILEVFMGNHAELFTTTASRADGRLLALCVILGITSWTSLCRLIRAETLKIREQDYVLAAKTLKVSHMGIIWQHVLPNLMHIIIITIVLDFSTLVLAEAVLSYIGVGVDPSMQSFGNMINSARLEFARDPVVWWSLTAAFMMMFLLVLAANLFADSVRDAFNPRIMRD